MVDIPVEVPVTPVTEQCIVRSAAEMNIPLDVFSAVLYHEAGKPGLAMPNTDGSFDLGPGQINTFWLKHFAKMGIHPEEILNNGCVNILGSAYILAGEIHATGDITKGVAQYHSRTPKHQKKYLGHIRDVMKRGVTPKDVADRANGKKIQVKPLRANFNPSVKTLTPKSKSQIVVVGAEKMTLPDGIRGVVVDE